MSITTTAHPQKSIYDYCIIGSGAMGIAVATRLAAANQNVLLIEAGADDVSAKNQEVCRCHTTGRPHPGSSEGRFRVYGGSTERWGGQAMRFEEIDFSPRNEIHETGWPISASCLSSYYPEAEKFMGVENPPYEQFRKDFEKAFKKTSYPKSALDDAFGSFKFHYSVFSHKPRMRELHRQALEKSDKITIWKNTTVIRLNTNGSGTIKSVTVRNDGDERQVAADRYILATGGIENARLLLIQRDVYSIPELGGNHLIGQFFQDHPGAHVAEITGKAAAFVQDLFRLKKTSTMSLKARISWSDEERSKMGLPGVSGTFLMMPRPSEFDDKHMGNRLRRPAPLDILTVIRAAMHGKIYSPVHYTYLAVTAEDVRSKKSAITLSETEAATDGHPRAQVNWVVDTRVSESIMAYTKRINDAFVSIGLGPLRMFDFMSHAESVLKKLRDNSHHIGSTSMGLSKGEGVVDTNLKAFGLNNLWVAGTSVLPTGSHANPTLTALALAFRLSDHLLPENNQGSNHSS